MSHPAFDPAGFVRFDLSNGTIRSSAEEPLALIPADVVSMLEPGNDLDMAARNWGATHGKRLADVLAGTDEPSTMDLLAEYLGGSLTTAGLGRLSIEIRGDALLFRIEAGDSATQSAGRRALIAGFIAGYLEAVGPAAFGVVHLGGDESADMFWAGNPDAARQLQSWLEQGMEPTAAVDRLGRGGDA
jgi:hypothetical protein